LSCEDDSGLSYNLWINRFEEKFLEATPPHSQLIRELVQSKIEKKGREI
jgi:hypothetical protein